MSALKKKLEKVEPIDFHQMKFNVFSLFSCEVGIDEWWVSVDDIFVSKKEKLKLETEKEPRNWKSLNLSKNEKVN